MFTDLIDGTFLAELLTVEDKDPGKKIEENEEIVGDMTELEKKIYALSNANGKMSGYLALKAMYDLSDGDEHESTLLQAHRLKDQSKCLKDLLWALIWERLNDTIGHRAIGVRKGFRIVAFEGSNEDEHPLAKILGHFKS